jgi:tetratricopeptide (TPR) repeat protein
VFISHTSELQYFPRAKSYVTAVKGAISAAGHVIVDMADLPAADQAPAQVCAKRVRECEVYVGVLGTLYGSPVCDRPEVSYTELEFDTATEARLDRLVFLLDTDAEDVGIPPSSSIDREFGARQDAFRRRVQNSGLTIRFFANPAELGQLVERSLRDLADMRARLVSGIRREQVPAEPQPVRASKFVNPPPATAPTWFQDRHVETGLLARYVTDPAIRLVTVTGRAGIGKTAVVCRLLKGLEAGRIPDVEGDSAAVTVGGIVYLSRNGAHQVEYPTLVADLLRLLPAEEAQRLQRLYPDPQHTPREVMLALLEAFPAGQPVVVLLDNLELVMDPECETLAEQALHEALGAVLTAPAHAVTVIATTRVTPTALLKVEPSRQRQLPLDEGLGSPDAETVLRALDDDGRLGLRDAPEELLDGLRRHTRGFPRALEAVKAILDGDRTLTPADLLDRTRHLPDDQVVQVLVGEAYDLLDPAAQQVMQALSVFPAPVSAVEVDSLLQPVNPATNAAPILSRLVRRQLARFQDGRYYLHPIDREYARNQLSPGSPAPSSAVAVPRQLPAAVARFAGRAAELEALTSLLEEAALPGGTVVISAIDGTAGIGKTALAVQWARQVAGRFPDGQLYVNLRGFDPAGPPMAPAEAVRGFLEAFEVPAARIPVSLDAQEALYRSLLAGRRVLVVLDNARDAGQVRPLLPGSPGCSAVVTSRNRLTGLIADGAHPLTVGLFTDTDARQMLVRRLGADRVAAQPQAVQQIIDRCARLPLALSIVAARAAARPDFPLMALAEELRDAEGRLPALDAGGAATSVTAVFSWSYQRLSDRAARLFRLLGLHPGPDITAPAAASLAAIPVPEARLLMKELDRAHLITEHAPGRFTFHDLLRAYATAQAHAHDSATGRDEALCRVLDHYLHTAQAAWYLSYPHLQRPITLAPPRPGVTPEEPADYRTAQAWFTAEYPVLLAAIHLAAATGHHTRAWQLPHTLVPFFERQGHWHDFADTHFTALTVAQHHADQQGQAHAHLGIGHAHTRRGRLGQARPHLQQALRLFEELGDAAGQSAAHCWLGMTFQLQECHEEALPHLQQAVDLARTGGYQRSIAAALNGLGWFHALLGNARQALTYCEQSLDLFQDIGDRWGEAATLDSIGYAHYRLGHHQQAASYFEQALAIDRELPDLYSRATDYDHLGDAHRAAGNTIQARNAWQQALDILDQLGDVPRMGASYADPDAILNQLGDVPRMGVGYADPDAIRAKLRPYD